MLNTYRSTLLLTYQVYNRLPGIYASVPYGRVAHAPARGSVWRIILVIITVFHLPSDNE